MAEYSYFRAEGASLKALETVMKARAKIEAISDRLAKSYGAEAFTHWLDWPFRFPPGSKLPENFEIQKIHQLPKNAGRPFLARPVSGTQEAFNVASVLGLMQRAIKNATPEGAFGCGEMPIKDIPAGMHCGAFVRERTVVDASNTFNQGAIYERGAVYSGYNQISHVSDNIMAMQFFDVWYIRIPNDPEGKPRFVPPDGVRMEYAEMLQIDRREYRRQRTDIDAFPPPRL